MYQFLHRCHAFDAFVRFHGIVVVEESDEFGLAVNAVFEEGLIMPHLYQCPYHSLSLSIRLWGFHLRKSLFDPVLRTELHEGVILTIFPRYSCISGYLSMVRT